MKRTEELYRPDTLHGPFCMAHTCRQAHLIIVPLISCSFFGLPPLSLVDLIVLETNINRYAAHRGGSHGNETSRSFRARSSC